MKKIFTIHFFCVLAMNSFTIHSQVSRFEPVNGIVRASVLNTATGILYIGGDFTAVNTYTTGGGAIISAATGLPEVNWPEINGAVLASVSDGAGGWYIGGSFTQVGGVARNRLAHINASKSVTGWNPNANDVVFTLAISGSTVYVGGQFTTIGGQPRNRIAALDLATGTTTGWNPGSNANVSILAISGSTVYVGGQFNTIGGQNRNRIAALDAATGTATGWNPGANGDVSTLAISGSTVYVGGNFTNIGGQNRNRIAALSTAAGTAIGWNPNANLSVNALALSGSTVYVGGDFTTIGGQSRNRIAALDAVAGTATGWNPNANNLINTLVVSGSTIYVGGAFTNIAGITRNYSAAFVVATGTVTGWDPNTNGHVRTLALSGSTMFVGGHFTGMGSQTRNRIAALHAATGSVTGWNPNANADVYTLALSGSTVYAGGFFTSIGGQTRSRIAALDAATGSVTGWNPNADVQVSTLAVSGSTVYAGGNFANIGGQPRNRIAALDAATGSVTGWNPNANGQVNSLAVSGSMVYVGGNFTNIGGQPRNNIAAFLSTATGFATTWNPGANGSVYSLNLSGNTIYAGGLFTNIGGQARNYITALDATAGTATGWNPFANGDVSTIAISGSTVYVGGNFTGMGSQTRNRIAALDATTGNATAWNPNASNLVRTLAVSGNTVYAGGDFTSITTQGSGGWVGAIPSYAARIDLGNTQTITGFGAIPAQNFGNAPYTISGVSATSGLAVTFSSNNPAVATVSSNGVVSLFGAGTVTITANQAGNNIYFAANSVSQVLTINQSSQTITGFGTIPAQNFGTAPYTISGVSATSGLLVTFSGNNPAVATVSSSGVVSMVGVGNVTITANQVGNSNYLAANAVRQVLYVYSPTLIVSQPISATVCSGNFNSFSVLGTGSGTISYLWSNGATGSTINTSIGGNYMVTASGLGGIAISSIAGLTVFTKPYFPSPPTTSSSCGCNINSFKASAIGSSSITYLWSNGTLGNTLCSTANGIFFVTATGVCGLVVTSTTGAADISLRMSSRVDYNVGNYPYGITTGDFNNDGKIDMVTANYSGQNLSIILGNGDGTFGSPTNFGGGPYQFSGVASGDFNNDGNLDVAVVTNSSNIIRVALGSGTGTFGGFIDNYADAYLKGLSLGDLNNDGKLDLITRGNGNSIGVYLGLGNGAFSGFGTNYFTGNNPNNYVIVDLNNDGNKDVVVANSGSNTISVLTGTGSGSFPSNNTYATGNSPLAIKAADFNSDGNQDIVVANHNDATASIFLGDGAGYLSFSNNVGTSNNPSSINIADINGDGNLDLVIGNLSAAVLNVLTGNGDGTFNIKVDFNTVGGSYNSAIADFDNDGFVDLANSSIGNKTSVYINNRGIQIINSFNPPLVTPNTILTINGYALNSITGVSFPGGVSAIPICNKTNSITVSVPCLAQTGFITLTGSALPVISSTSLTISLSGTKFTSQPISATVCSGIVQTFSATASGIGTISYLWNNGQTSNIMSTSVAGSYTVTATGLCGVDISTTVGLTLKPLTIIITQPVSATVLSGMTNTFVASATGFGLSYLWNNGANTSSMVTSVAGNYQCTISGSCGTITSNIITLTVNLNPQTITGFGTIPGQMFGNAPYTILGVSATSGLIVTFSGNNPAVATVSSSGVVTILGAGPVTITANQVGNVNYLAANPVIQIITVNKASQTITGFVTIPAQNFGSAPYTILGVSATSGLLVTFSGNNPAVATVSSIGEVSILGAGTVTITANQVGNVNYFAANAVSQVLTINPLPTVVGFSTGEICRGSAATITATGALTYFWQPGGISGSVVTVNPSFTTIYTIVGTSSFGTTATGFITVTVNSLPTVSGISNVICLGNTTSLTATGAITYNWQPGNLSGAIQSINPSSTTNYSVTGTNGFGCTATGFINVTVNSLPTVSGVSSAICIGNTTNLTATGATTYNWQPGNLSGAIQSLSPANTTNYSVTGTNGFGCTATGFINVTVNSLPTVSGISTAICIGNTTSLTAIGATTYNWQPGNLSGAIQSLSPLSTTNYSVTGTNGFGCTATGFINVTVNSLPTVSGISSAICLGRTTNLTAAGATTYNWQPGNFTGAIQSLSPLNTTTYSVTGTNGFGCTATGFINVTVNSLPTVSGISSAICRGNTTNLTATGATTYNWQPGNLTGAIQSLSPVNTTIYSVTGTNGFGCTATGFINVTVNSLPTVSGVSPGIICNGNAGVLTAAGASIYNWQPGSLSGSMVSVNPISTTTYTIVGTNSFGCTATGLTTLMVNGLPSIATINASQSFVCNSQSITLNTVGTTAGTIVYAVNTGAGFNVLPSNTYTFTNTIMGDAFSFVGYAFVAGCQTVSSPLILVNSSICGLTANYTASPNPICISTASSTGITFTNTSSSASGTILGYSWSFGAGASPSSTIVGINNTNYTINVKYSSSGNKSILLSIVGIGGAINTVSGTIQVDELSSIGGISIGSNPICINTNASMSVNTVNSSVFTWFSSDNNINYLSTGINSANYNPTLSANTYYKVVAVNGICPAFTTAGVLINVNSIPGVSVNYISPVCQNTPSLLPSALNTVVGGVFASLQAGLAINSVTGVIIPNAGMAGNYGIRYTYSIAGCGAQSFTVPGMIQIDDISTIGGISIGSNPICINTNASLSVNTVNSSVFTWFSSDNNINYLSTGINSANYNPTLSANTYYKVVATNGICPAFTTAGVLVNVNSIPGVSINYTSPVCQNAISLLPSASNTVVGGVFASLQAGLAINSVTGVIIPNAGMAGNYGIRYNYSIAGCGAQSFTVQGMVQIDDISTIGGISIGSNPICINTSASLSVNTVNGSAFTWFSSDNNINYVSIGINSNNYNPTLSANKYYKVVATNGICPAFTTAGVLVNVNSIPGMSINYTSPVCQNATSLLPSALNTVVGGVYATLQAGLAINSITGMITPNAGMAGNYAISYTYSIAGCGAQSYTVPGMVQVDDISTIGGISIGSNPICINTNASLSVNTVNSSVFTWFSSDNNINYVSIGINSVDYNPTLSANTYYKVVATNGICPAFTTAGVLVNVNSIPGVSINYTSPVCQNATSLLPSALNTVVGGVYATLQAGLAINSVTGMITPNAGMAGNYAISYTYSIAGCGAQSYTVPGMVQIDELSSIGGIAFSSNPVCNTVGLDISVVTINGSNLQWYSSIDNINYANMGITADLFNTILGSNTYFKASIKNGTCPAITSSGISLVTVTNCVVATSVSIGGSGTIAMITSAGGSLQMTASVFPLNASNTLVGWSINPTSVATINSITGVVTALTNGIATVTGTLGTIVGVSIITVTGQAGIQLITFGVLPSKTFNDATFMLTATATSGLPVSYVSSNPQVAIVSGNVVSVVGAGITTITASQVGNLVFLAAPTVSQILTINKLKPNLSLSDIPIKTLLDAPFNLQFTVSSGLSISATSSNPSVVTLFGLIASVTGTGNAIITLRTNGNSNYLADSVSKTVQVIGKVNQTISAISIADKTFGDAVFEFESSSSAQLSVSVSSLNPEVLRVFGNTASIVGAGTAIIAYNQAGNTLFNPASTVYDTVFVDKAPQVITFPPIPNKIIDDRSFPLIAKSNSGLPVKYNTSDSTIVALNASTAFVLKIGVITLTASIGESANYYAAENAYSEVTVSSIPAIYFGINGKNIVPLKTVLPFNVVMSNTILGYNYLWKYIGKGATFHNNDSTSAQINIIFDEWVPNGFLQLTVFDKFGNEVRKEGKYIIVSSSDNSDYTQLKELNCIDNITLCKKLYIDNVKFNTLISTFTGCVPGGKSDFTYSNYTTTLNLGEFYNLEIECKSDMTSKNRYYGVWIDYQNDGNFDETDDFISSFFGTTDKLTIKNIRIRNISGYEGVRKLRIKLRSSKEFTALESCETGTDTDFGETEDYLINLKSLEELEASEFLSPNNDGKNDYFAIRGINPKESNRLIIMDRYGTLIYEKENYKNDWEAKTIDNKNVQDDTYFYFFSNGNKNIKGFLEIKRK